MPQRILRATAASLSWQPLDGDGEPADPGTVTVGVVSSDGATVVAAGTATSGSASDPRTAALTVAPTLTAQTLIPGLTTTITVPASSAGSRPASAQPLLNQRAAQLIGRTVELAEPIRNGRGKAPVKIGRLDARVVRFIAGSDVRSIRLPLTSDIDELVVTVLRDSRNSVCFAFNNAPPPGLVQARLW